MRNNAQISVLRFFACIAPLLIAACSSVPLGPTETPRATAPTPAAPSASASVPALPPAGSGRGGYYQDDGPGDAPPPNLMAVPDAEPAIEPYATRGNKPYVVFGKIYTPILDDRPLKQRGIGSWYGKKFHGQRTSSGEPYDMYKMTAAHPTLPIPSYARVTNLNNGKQVVVRVNDRGPFHSDRIIDLSYTAALKLGYLGKGSGMLEVERLLPEEIKKMAANRSRPAAVDNAPAEVTTANVVMPEVTTARMPSPAVGDMPTGAKDQPATVAVTAMNEPALTSPPGMPALAAPSIGATAAASNDAKNGVKGTGFYLQLGAYAKDSNAQAVRAKLERDLAGVAVLEVVPVNGTARIFAGPYASRAAAQQALGAVRQKTALTPFIVER